MDEQKEAQQAAQQVFPKDRQPGRMALQIFALLVLVGLVAYGVFAWKNTQITTLNNQIADLKKQVNDLQASSSQTAEPEWKSYTTKYEKLTFSYPSSAKVVETDTPGGSNLDPGSEVVTVTTTSGLGLKIWNGADGIGGACPDCKNVKNDTLKLFGGTSYLNYVDQGDGTISALVVATSKDAFMSSEYKSKNITIKSSGEATLNLYNIAFYDSDGAPTNKKLADFTGDATLADLKKIVESFSY